MRRMSQEFLELITLLILGGIPYLFWATTQGYALEMPDRSITISTAVPSATATHSFQMTFNNSASLIGSIEFQYCSNSPLISDPCVAPIGLSLSGAALSSQTVNTGFSIDNADSTASSLIINRTPALSVDNVSSSYVFSNVINPSVDNQTTYVRITTYSTTDGTGSIIENGSVAFATTSTFQVGAFVPPYLNLCVGITVADNCSQASDNSIDLGNLSTNSTAVATSQVAAATNSDSGYGLFVLGTTMTSGNNVIPAPTSPISSRAGSGEFGINLRQNNNPAIGADPDGNGSAALAPDYNLPNLFSFVPGTQIASSPVSTDYNRLTISYIVNVGNQQPPGIYSTTLTYLATAQF